MSKKNCKSAIREPYSKRELQSTTNIISNLVKSIIQNEYAINISENDEGLTDDKYYKDALKLEGELLDDIQSNYGDKCMKQVGDLVKVLSCIAGMERNHGFKLGVKAGLTNLQYLEKYVEYIK